MSSILDISKHLSIKHNVSFNIYDEITGQLLQHHEGHNAATNSMLTGIGHYLIGDGVLNQGSEMLTHWIPRYISLGTMGLHSQDVDSVGLPTGIGPYDDPDGTREEENCIDYMNRIPGFGADGYDANLNNERPYFGLGKIFKDRPYGGRFYQSYTVYDTDPHTFTTDYPIKYVEQVLINDNDVTSTISYTSGASQFSIQGAGRPNSVVRIYYLSSDPSTYKTIDCELISDTFPRAQISYRKIIPEVNSEIPKTIDIIFSAMISTGALKQFREADKDYILITEAGLWSKKFWPTIATGQADYFSGDNGLLAGYRIAPPDEKNWDMHEAANRELLKKEILRVGLNQVVQVVWKIQLGSIEEYGGWENIYKRLRWVQWEANTHWADQTIQDWPEWYGANEPLRKPSGLSWYEVINN